MYIDKKNLKHLFISQSLKTCSDFYQTPNFRMFSYNNKKKDKKNSYFSKIIRTKTINIDDTAIKFFDSFHKSLMHRKLSSNPKYIEMNHKICHTTNSNPKYIEMENKNCNTTRSQKEQLKEKYSEKKSILKNNLKKLFLTNNNESLKKRKTKFKLIDENKNISSHKRININIKSNIFLPYNENKYIKKDYPDVLFPKINDFIEDIKLIRTVKFINNIKTAQKNYEFSQVDLEGEKYDVTINSLTQSIKLLKSYNSCFTHYNKFLIGEINKEKNILNDYIIKKNIVEDQVMILQKKFDDLILELENLSNFKNLFSAIKNRIKIKNNNLSNKTFAELTIEKLKEKFLINKKSTTIHMSTKLLTTKRKIHKKNIHSTKKIKEEDAFILFDSPLKNSVNKRNVKNSVKKIDKESKLESLDNTQVPIHKIRRKLKKNQTVINIDFHNKYKNEERKIERLNSYQASPNINISNMNNSYKNKIKAPKVKFEKFDVQKELDSLTNNILNLIKKYNDNDHFNRYYKLFFENEGNSILERNQQLRDNINYLNFCKNYNVLLISKLKIAKNQNNDSSLFIFIYHKINELVVSIQNYKIKISQRLLDKINNSYDKNKLLYQYKIEKNRNESYKAFLEKELINYIYKMITLFERLLYELIQGKNKYLSNNYYSERIEEYENKMDNAKKIINNRFKRNEEILRKKKINEDTIKKWYKILYKPFKKVAHDYKISVKTKKQKLQNQENENENLLFY